MDRGHPLAKRRSLKFRDLAGETVMIMKPGTSPVNDSMRAALAAVPLEEDFSIKYGVIACRAPGGDMERFLEDLENKLLSCN